MCEIISDYYTYRINSRNSCFYWCIITMGFLSQMTNDPSPFQGHMRIHGAAALSFVLFIAVLVVAFAVKHTKIVGIISIIISVITLIAMGGFGIVGFALLLAGGIVSLAYKDKPQPKYNPDTGEVTS